MTKKFIKNLLKLLFFTTLVTFTLGQLTRLQLGKVGIIYYHDVAITLYITASLALYPKKIWRKIRLILFNKVFIGLCLSIIIGLIFNTLFFISDNFLRLIIPILYIGRAFLYAFFGLSVTTTLSIKKLTLNKAWISVGLGMAILGLLQYFLLPDTRFLKFAGWDDHLYRLIGPLLDPNFTGLLLTLTFFLSLDPRLPKFFSKFSLLILPASILLTYSRASYLSFIIGMSLLLLFSLNSLRKKSLSSLIYPPKFFILGIILFIMAIPFLPRPDGEGVKLERTASITARVSTDQALLEQLHPAQWILGQSWFRYQEREEELLDSNHKNKTDTTNTWPNTAHFADNLFVFLLTSGGIIGLGLSLLILYKTGIYMMEKDIYIFTAFIAILIHSQFNHSLFQPFIWLWITNQAFSLTSKNEKQL